MTGPSGPRQAPVKPEADDPAPPPYKEEEVDKCQAEPVREAPEPDQGGEDTASDHSSHVVVANPAAEAQAVSTCCSSSDRDLDDAFDELRSALLEEVRGAVVEAVRKHIATVLTGTLQPLEKRLDGVYRLVQEHGKRLEATAKEANERTDDVAKLSNSVTRLTRQSEGAAAASKEMRDDVKSLLTEVGGLQELHKKTSSALEAVVAERTARRLEPEMALHRDRPPPRSASRSHVGGSGRRHHSATGSRDADEDAARRERRRKRQEEEQRRSKAESKDAAKDSDKGKEKRHSKVSWFS